MHFEIKSPFVFVHDTRPGAHVSLFGTHAQKYGSGVVRYPFRADHSSFNDATSQYTWAFEASPAGGEVLVCAMADREIIGQVHGDIATEVMAHASHPQGLRVYRIAAAGDKPLTLI